MPARGLPRGYRAKTTADYPPMSADEYNRAREQLKLNGINFAQLIGVGWRNGQRYQAGHTIPEPVARLIRTIVNNRWSATVARRRAHGPI